MISNQATKIGLILLLLLPALGCSSIHSKAVRSLVAKEGEKLASSNKAADAFVSASQSKADAMMHALASLDSAIKKQNTSEMVHTLIFSANQNLHSKQGVDAHAATYLVGRLYLAEQAGLEKAVNDQFLADIAALQQQAQKIRQSWAALANLHQKVADFAQKSALASVDADFLAALAGEIPGASAELDKVLNDSQQLNNALKAALSFGGLNQAGTQLPQSQINDLLDLLERIKASPQTNSP
ncbi:MAG TPA: hypothetical protein VL361_03350 [Candidatus Limnocylindrales bacterium]|jgi:hypothetical protein|nr:hypothetical protein [Candidatus Limnocylindrales bacterium]